ncbi:MAG: (2Fe-2S)-binding protein [Spirochaetales bacterium]|nr:(2Fe-2S)-binding protein [Spirochaetales bacterium]
MAKITINNKEITVRENETILAAAKKAGISIPTLCHMEGFPPSGACRICVVELEGRGLVPSCSFPAADGMRVQTHSPRALKARKTVVELLLANHPDSCNYCARNQSCRLQTLASELGVRQRVYVGHKEKYKLDASSPAIVRDPAKCILCGRCVRVCEEVQGVAAIDFVRRGSKTVIAAAFEEGLNLSACVNCGQCINVCPTGALTENSHVKRVLDALSDPALYCVVQHAPAVSVSIAEEFGFPAGSDVDGLMVAALRRLGFKKVFDTAFTADLTIMEEGSELVHRIKNRGALPMLTSCSPGWIKFIEQFYPDLLPNVSTCKSPQQMMGAIVKSYFAETGNLNPRDIFSVSVMPCTAKKFEAQRPEMACGGVSDVDAVLTTRELAQVFRMYGFNLKAIAPEAADTPFGTRSTAGKLFGGTGGVMEAAIRSAYFLLTGTELENPVIDKVRGLEGRKEAYVTINGMEVGVAVASGLANARKVLDAVRAGRNDLHFIEIMTCPGGCIAGGGQPLGADLEAVKARLAALYDLDCKEGLRLSHKNEDVVRLYKEYLVAPLGEKSHRLLHTHYHAREIV